MALHLGPTPAAAAWVQSLSLLQNWWHSETFFDMSKLLTVTQPSPATHSSLEDGGVIDIRQRPAVGTEVAPLEAQKLPVCVGTHFSLVPQPAWLMTSHMPAMSPPGPMSCPPPVVPAVVEPVVPAVV